MLRPRCVDGLEWASLPLAESGRVRSADHPVVPQPPIEGATTWHGESKMVRTADPTELSIALLYGLVLLLKSENLACTQQSRQLRISE